MKLRCLMATALVIVCVAAAEEKQSGPSAGPPPELSAQPQPPAGLLPELRKGGYVLFIRHPKTNPDQAATDPLNLDNVKAQRHLSDDGRGRARVVGRAFRDRKLPMEKVGSSKSYCTQEAAKL